MIQPLKDFDPAALMAGVLEQAGATVMDLQPGDLVTLPGPHGLISSTFVAQTAHPIWPHLRLVVWRTDPELRLPGDWSHDALDPRQVVGTVTPSTSAERAERLRAALLGGA